MEKLKNIPFLLLAFVLFASVGCTSQQDLCEKQDLCDKRPEPPQAGQVLEPEQVLADEGVSELALPGAGLTQPSIEMPVFVEPTPVAVEVPGPYVASMIYPSTECGVVRLDKSMPKEVELNKPFDYSIKVTNLRSMTLTDVVVTEDIPENFKLVSAVPTAQIDANKLVWKMDSLGPRASSVISVSGMATGPDVLKHCTTVVSRLIPACADVVVVEPKLELKKTAPQDALLCDPIPVKFELTNPGTGSAQNVKITETLPAGFQTAAGESELVIDAGTLAAGDSRQFSVEIKADKAGKYVGKAVASSEAGLKAESETTTTVVGKPLLTISQAGTEKQYVGRPVSYQITVTNDSDTTARNVLIENAVPTAVTSMKATVGAKLAEPRKIVWKLDAIGPHSSEKVRVSFTPTKAGTLTNSVTVTAHCAESVNALAKTTVTAIPAVLMEVIDIDDPIEIGDRTTYAITVTNQGSANSTNINIVCVLEDNVRYVSSTGPTTGSIDQNTLTFASLASLSPKAKASWRVVVAAVKPGDVRFKATLNTDQLTRSVEETEATHLYE